MELFGHLHACLLIFGIPLNLSSVTSTKLVYLNLVMAATMHGSSILLIMQLMKFTVTGGHNFYTSFGSIHLHCPLPPSSPRIIFATLSVNEMPMTMHPNAIHI